jgi:hypothetical protein
VGGGVHNLAWLGLLEAELAGHAVDAAGLRELGLRQTELAILFAELVAHLFLRLDAVGVLDGVEVLQAIDHDERKQDCHRGREDAHLARTDRICRLDEAGVVEVMGEDDLRGTDSAAAHGLLCEQCGIALDHASGPAGFGIE